MKYRRAYAACDPSMYGISADWFGGVKGGEHVGVLAWESSGQPPEKGG